MARKIPIIVTAIYLILVVLAIIPIFTSDDALAGIFAIVLTEPWSSLFDNFLPDSAFDSITGGLLLVTIGAAINAALLYFISRWLVNRYSNGYSLDH